MSKTKKLLDKRLNDYGLKLDNAVDEYQDAAQAAADAGHIEASVINTAGCAIFTVAMSILLVGDVIAGKLDELISAIPLASVE